MGKTYIKPFTSKISKSGNSKVITVPSYLIRAELVDPKKEYLVQLKEADKNARHTGK